MHMHQHLPPNSIVPTHVILAGITEPQVDCWEVAFEFTPGTGEIIDVEFPHSGSINFATAPFFIVGQTSPIYTPPEGYLILAEMEVLFLGGVQDWYGGPVETPIIPNRPSYTSSELMIMVPCYFSTDAEGEHLNEDGWTTWPLASINGEAPVHVEVSTWSDVKALYRR